MEPFTTLNGVAASLPQDDVDTDQILPTPWLRDPKADLAKGLFGYLRRAPAGKTESDFVLEQPAFRQARILVCGSNFGCGSSREHAVWAVKAFGIRCLIAASFADIFRENCLRNGVLAIRLPAEEIDALHREVQDVAGPRPSWSISRTSASSARTGAPSLSTSAITNARPCCSDWTTSA
jgi:3-isopropylmalate/(R)-2-methylmalate dehydratase small subunit